MYTDIIMTQIKLASIFLGDNLDLSFEIKKY